MIVQLVYEKNETPEDVPSLHWELRHIPDYDCVETLSKGHIVCAAFRCLTHIWKLNLSYILRLLFNLKGPALSNLYNGRYTWTTICKLIPNPLDRDFGLRGPAWIVIVIHAHCMK